MHRTPTIRDSTVESVRREHEAQTNAIRDMYLEALRKNESPYKAITQSRPGTLLRRERIHGDREPYPFEEARAFRMHILAMSMFPNIYSGLALTSIGPN